MLNENSRTGRGTASPRGEIRQESIACSPRFEQHDVKSKGRGEDAQARDYPTRDAGNGRTSPLDSLVASDQRDSGDWKTELDHVADQIRSRFETTTLGRLPLLVVLSGHSVMH